MLQFSKLSASTTIAIDNDVNLLSNTIETNVNTLSNRINIAASELSSNIKSVGTKLTTLSTLVTNLPDGTLAMSAQNSMLKAQEYALSSETYSSLTETAKNDTIEYAQIAELAVNELSAELDNIDVIYDRLDNIESPYANTTITKTFTVQSGGGWVGTITQWMDTRLYTTDVVNYLIKSIELRLVGGKSLPAALRIFKVINNEWVLYAYAKGTNNVQNGNSTHCFDFTEPVSIQHNELLRIECINTGSSSYPPIHAADEPEPVDGTHWSCWSYVIDENYGYTTSLDISPSEWLHTSPWNLTTYTSDIIYKQKISYSISGAKKINNGDASEYPMTWVYQPYSGGHARVAGVAGGTNYCYQCDQWYHYFINGTYTYIYDINCKFVTRLTAGFALYYHDRIRLQNLIATNRNNIVCLMYASGTGDIVQFRLLKFDNTQIASIKNLGKTPVSGTTEAWYISHSTSSRITVNDITNHFIIFTTFKHYTETTNDDGTVTINNVILGNGYFCLNEEGLFTKYDPDTETWITSTTLTPDVFTLCENARTNYYFISTLGEVVLFRNTWRNTITNPNLQCVTWVAHITKSTGLDGVWALNEFDQLIPVRGTAGATGFDENGIINLNGVNTWLTISSTKRVAVQNAPYLMYAHSTPDTLTDSISLVACLISGEHSYILTKNVSTGNVSASRRGTGIVECHPTCDNNTYMTNKPALQCADGGQYGGAGYECYNMNQASYIPRTIATERIPIHFTGTNAKSTFATGLRATRLQTSYPSNFMNVGNYAATWRGALHIDI